MIVVKKLTVENCTLSNFSDKGIDINSTAAADITISHVTIHNAGDGISMEGAGGFMVIDRSYIQGIKNTGITISNGKPQSVIQLFPVVIRVWLQKQDQQFIYQGIS